MSFCEHCQGQRFDRARVLRALRQIKRDVKASSRGIDVEAVVLMAETAIRTLDIPHLGPPDEDEDLVVH